MKGVSKTGLALTSISLICSGLCCIVDEYILAQLSSNILGNPAQQWPLVIGLMLFATGVGAWLAQFVKEEKTLQGFIVVELILSLLGGFSPLIILGAYAYFFVHFKLIFYVVSFLIGLLIGFEQPLIATINKKFVAFRSNISMTISLDVLGAAIGTFIWIKFLVGKMEIYYAAFIVSGINLAVALFTYYFLWKQNKDSVKSAWKTIVAILLVGLVAGIGLFKAKDFADLAEQKLFTGKIIHKESSLYQRIVMTEHPKSGDVMMFLNGGLQFCSRDEKRYHENLVHPALAYHQMTNPKDSKISALVLGGGDGMAVRELKKYPNLEDITLVDLDPSVVQLAKQHPTLVAMNDSAFFDPITQIQELNLPTSKEKQAIKMPSDEMNQIGEHIYETIDSVQVFHEDAYNFVEQLVEQSKRYDIIIIDFPDPRNESLAKLYSKYFFSRIRLLLKPSGFATIQSSSPVHAKKAFICVGKTMRAAGLDVMPYHDNIPSFNEWGWYLASRKEMRHNLLGIAHKMQNMSAFSVETSYLTPQKFQSNTIFGKDMLEGAEEIEVSTLANPKVYHYYVHYGWKLQ